MTRLKLLFSLLLAHMLFSPPILADQVLVKISEGKVTESQLEKAMLAAPFATQFPSMNEKDQAYLRGDMLMWLVKSEALFQEAKQLGLDNSRSYIEEINNFRMGLLAQRYLNTLQDKTQAPDSLSQKLKDIQDHNALSTARSAYTARRFKQLKKDTFSELKNKYQVKLSLDKLADDAVLATGNGFTIKYSDLIPST